MIHTFRIRQQSRQNFGLPLFLSLLTLLVACEQPEDQATIENDKMNMGLPITISSVDTINKLTAYAYIRDVNSTNAETKIQLSIEPTGSGDLRATGTSFQLTNGNTYSFRFDVKYDFYSNNQYDLVILSTPTTTFTATLDGDTIKGNPQYDPTIFGDRSIFPDSDSDGYTNLDEIDASRGDSKTDPFNTFDFPNNNFVIKSPRRLSMVVCPKLDAATFATITNRTYPTLDFRACANTADATEFTVMHSAGDQTMAMIMSRVPNFATTNMVHTNFSPSQVPFANQYKHSALGGLSYYNLLDSDCTSAINTSPVCKNIITPQPGDGDRLALPVSPIFFVSAPSRELDINATKYLPSWMRLDDIVDETSGKSYIKVSWEKMYSDSATTPLRMKLWRSTAISITPVAGSSDNIQQVSRQLIADGNILSSTYTVNSDSMGFETVEYDDFDVKGGVIYYYSLVTVIDAVNNITTATSPIGIATHAAIPFIDEFPKNNFRGDVVTEDRFDTNTGLTHEILKLAQPVAYGTVFEAYYFPNDIAIRTRDQYHSACASPVNTTCKYLKADSSYEFALYDENITGVGNAITGPTNVLIEKKDRYGRYAGYQIRRISN